MNDMSITAAQYCVDRMSNENVSVQATIDGQALSVPMDEANRHYAEILKQVAAGTLTIQEAT